MALDRALGYVTVFRHFDPRGDHPILPGNFTAQLVVHGEGHIADEWRDQINKLLGIDHVLKLRNAIRGEVFKILIL